MMKNPPIQFPHHFKGDEFFWIHFFLSGIEVSRKISEKMRPPLHNKLPTMDVEPKIGFFFPLNFNQVFPYFHHPFWGTTIFGNTHKTSHTAMGNWDRGIRGPSASCNAQ